jgi:hypothetical protein
MQLTMLNIHILNLFFLKKEHQLKSMSRGGGLSKKNVVLDTRYGHICINGGAKVT